MFFLAYHSVNLVIFAGAVVFAWRAVLKLRATSATYKARLLPFAYFSLTSWILWALQYVILLAGPSLSQPSGVFLNTGLGLGVIQNALWACAVLSLSSKKSFRMPLAVAALITFSNIIALIAYQTTVLSSQLFTQIDVLSAATIFTAFAVLAIDQLRLSKITAAAFLIHGYSQWIWRSLWFTPLAKTHSAILLGFPLWRIVLLVAWIQLISAILQGAEPAHEKSIANIERLELPDPIVTHLVMISSTVEDLAQERDAVDRAIGSLGLTRFRAETFGSLPHTPREICISMAKRCDIFILITGEHYGHIIEEGISAVELEFEVARADNPEKILVYVKDRVERDARLNEFLQRLQNFDHGYFRSLFKTPEELYERIQHDVGRWLALQVRPPKEE